MTLCQCGCGGQPKLGNNYIHGHSNKGKKGTNSSGWKGGKVMIEGYWYIYKPKHPYCNHLGYIAEHRLIVEQYIGRYLFKDEDIHHKNGIKTDNRQINLELLEHGKHTTLTNYNRDYSNRTRKLIDMSNRICSFCNNIKTSIIKKTGRPDWRYFNGRLVCASCYGKEKWRIKNRLK